MPDLSSRTIFLDFNRAFSATSHSILLDKLFYCEMNRFTLCSVMNWLNWRSQMWLHLTGRCALSCSQELNSRACTFRDFSQWYGCRSEEHPQQVCWWYWTGRCCCSPGEMRNVVEGSRVGLFFSCDVKFSKGKFRVLQLGWTNTGLGDRWLESSSAGRNLGVLVPVASEWASSVPWQPQGKPHCGMH